MDDTTVAGRSPEPPAVGDALRQAFAGEVADHLPDLERAAASGTATERARQAAHCLGSSAYVVGARDLAVLARDVEARLSSGQGWEPPTRALVGALREWRA